MYFLTPTILLCKPLLTCDIIFPYHSYMEVFLVQNYVYECIHPISRSNRRLAAVAELMLSTGLFQMWKPEPAHGAHQKIKIYEREKLQRGALMIISMSSPLNLESLAKINLKTCPIIWLERPPKDPTYILHKKEKEKKPYSFEHMYQNLMFSIL